MLNNPEKVYLISGMTPLLEAAVSVIQTLPQLKRARDDAKDKGEFIEGVAFYPERNEYFYTSVNGLSYDIPLTLPKDWDQLMTILDSLKQPKVPEYVKYSHRYEEYVGKVISKFTTTGVVDFYKVYNSSGKYLEWIVDKCTPITEEEFIQGGLKELEEAGFVVGAKVEYAKAQTFPIHEIEYSSTSQKTVWHSQLTQKEVKDQGFVFGLKGNYNHVPVGHCTLLPKAQTLPTTSQGIPYTRDQDTLYLGPVPNGNGKQITLKASQLRYLLRQGVTDLVTLVGHLTWTDLTLITKA